MEDQLSAQELVKKKDEIEEEISTQDQILKLNANVGMDGPLIDREGFPRSDIDVFAVRKARNRIICLGNDHKAIMKQIEAKIHDIHAEAREKGLVSSATTQGQEQTKIIAFASVSTVSDGSPASSAGLQVDDQIVGFGSVTAANFNSLQDIANVVHNSLGRSIRVVLLRDNKTLSLSITPQQWSGRGLLGCTIVPLSS